MKNSRIGFIGGGALTMSMLGNLVKSLPPDHIFVCDRKPNRCQDLREQFHINATTVAAEFVPNLDLLVLAVKPKDARGALTSLAAQLARPTVVVSVVAGLTIASIEEILPHSPIVRVMPNVAQAVGAGMAAWSAGSQCSPEAAQKVVTLWNLVGRTVEVPENLLDAVTGLSGSGPAFAFIAIEAMADGGVAAGLPRDTALYLAAQTLMGAAKMVLETGTHPAALKDRVTSPAGTTIAGLRVLEAHAVRSAFIEAVLAAADKAKKI